MVINLTGLAFLIASMITPTRFLRSTTSGEAWSAPRELQGRCQVQANETNPALFQNTTAPRESGPRWSESGIRLCRRCGETSSAHPLTILFKKGYGEHYEPNAAAQWVPMGMGARHGVTEFLGIFSCRGRARVESSSIVDHHRWRARSSVRSHNSVTPYLALMGRPSRVRPATGSKVGILIHCRSGIAARAPNSMRRDTSSLREAWKPNISHDGTASSGVPWPARAVSRTQEFERSASSTTVRARPSTQEGASPKSAASKPTGSPNGTVKGGLRSTVPSAMGSINTRSTTSRPLTTDPVRRSLSAAISNWPVVLRPTGSPSGTVPPGLR